MTVEDHYPSMAQLTPFHREKIAELRSRASDLLRIYPEYDTDFSMLRWLMGWDYDIDNILPRMTGAIGMITNLGLDKAKAENPEQINAYIRQISTASEYFPGGLMGTDDDGNVVYMQAIAQTHPKSLVKAGSVSELFRLSIAETEMAFKLVRRAEAHSGKKLGVKIIMDLDGFSMDLLYTPTLKIYKTLLTIMQDVFPDFARKIYLINTPLMIKTVYTMISPVLSKQTKEKVMFLGSDWKEVLINDLGAHNIYPHWGGNKKHSKSKGDLRMGGKCPEKLFYIPENNPDEENLKKINISARSREEVRVRGEKGKHLRWLFRVSSGDIDFSVEKDGYEVYPKFRLSTEFVPEIGKMFCRETGDYIFCFDNSHGSVWSKDVKYKIQLE